MADMPILTPDEEQLGNPPEEQIPETPTDGAGQEGTPDETTLLGSESSPDKRIKELERDYSASSTEAKRLAAENKLLKAKLEGNTSGNPPSNEELARTIPDWDMLSPAEQMLYREQVMLKRQIARLGQVATQSAKELTWENQFSELVKDSRFSGIKKAEFKEFCEGQEPSEKLAKAFLFDEAEKLGAKKEAERRARAGLEPGTGGDRKPAPKEMTLEETGKLRLENPKLYNKLIREGKIK